MPRVSEEHLERRRKQILEAAQRCFTRKGFHETSMQDVFAEAGLSAGAVYRYFASKNDIIFALILETMTPLRGRMAEIIRSEQAPTPAEVVRLVTSEVIKRGGPDGPLRLAPQAWAMAMVQPEASVPVRAAIAGMRELWREYAVRMRELGWIPPDADVDAMAKSMISFLPGFMLQHLLLEDVNPDDFARGVELMLGIRPVARG
ncbi:TetR family transcriptional regulator [Nocardia neocaledoniensis NBRC 108232]|uniref:TetR family transcriptional regulator n=1 Tax=Nocardia neocaledoniensis TaxID=236511 RepID=A0A317NCA8_9NOCA|nr:TetR/AcrR family transcriptional regulator [Nocardia neocaledoniensis]PWV72966.1 TetR family transcriptional regulator [Nocardia neocaledoniensis]GEM33344.1 TetR family transcriptional regulator [Nocardia neocaledoniensis NBRC 108232]